MKFYVVIQVRGQRPCRYLSVPDPHPESHFHWFPQSYFQLTSIQHGVPPSTTVISSLILKKNGWNGFYWHRSQQKRRNNHSNAQQIELNWIWLLVGNEAKEWKSGKVTTGDGWYKKERHVGKRGQAEETELRSIERPINLLSGEEDWSG